MIEDLYNAFAKSYWVLGISTFLALIGTYLLIFSILNTLVTAGKKNNPRLIIIGITSLSIATGLIMVFAT